VSVMTDDRVVPGRVMGAARMRAPNDWTRVEFEIPRTPPSMNSNEVRSHWTGFHAHKKSWQAEIEQMLMVMGISRGGQRAIAGAVMRFPRPHARRDSGNFSSVVEKALGDALVNGRWIPDDDAERYAFIGVEFDGEAGPKRTTLVVFIQPGRADAR
jgi:hypothetical protein